MNRIACVAGIFLGVAAAQAGPRSIPSERFPAPFGVNIHFTKGSPGEVAKLSSAYKVARMDFVWDRTERVKGRYDFSAYDGLVRELEAAGVQPYFILDYGNNLYQQGPPRTHEARAAYAHWAAAAVSHYKGHKILWELWNEPNGDGFWGGRANAEEYAALVNAAGPAIRRADSQATLLIGALSGFPWDFINVMIRRGNLQWADAFSVHPYRSGFPESVGSDYARLRRMIHQATGGRDIPIVSGEWGYSTNRKSGISEERQAQYLVRQRLYNARCGVPVSIWYDWKEDGPDPDENEHHFGSVYPDLRDKPAFRAAETLTATLAGYEFVRMLVDEPTAFVMLLRNGKGGFALAMWTTGARRSFAVKGKGIRVVDMLGSASKDDGKAERVISYGPSPTYVLLGRNPDMLARASWRWVRPAAHFPAGRLMRTTFTVRNPFESALACRFRLTADGGEVRPSALTLALRPHETREVPVWLALWRRGEAATLRVEASVRGGGVETRETAGIPIGIDSPLAASMDLMPGRATIAIDSAASAETLTATVVTRNGLPAAAPVCLTLGGAKGQHAEAAIRLPGPASAAYGLRVRDAAGHIVASVPATRSNVIYSFEDSAAAPRGISLYAEGDAKIGGEARISIARSDGRGSVADIRASFPDGWRYFVVTPSRQEIADDVYAVSMWVNGDGSDDTIRCRIVDAKGQVYQPTYGRITWKGWKRVTMRLDDPTVGSWGGPQDGIIHRPIRWDSVFLLDGTGKAHTCHVQVDDIALLSSASPAP